MSPEQLNFSFFSSPKKLKNWLDYDYHLSKLDYHFTKTVKYLVHNLNQPIHLS